MVNTFVQNVNADWITPLIIRTRMVEKFGHGFVLMIIAIMNGKVEYGDCISIEIMHEKTPGQWHYAHFSPARAKIFALQILERVEILENSDPGKKCIDTEFDVEPAVKT